MPAGELKHGPIALIDKNIPVICLAPNHLFDKTASNIENIFSRDGRIVLISDKSGLEYFSKFNDQIIGSIEVDSTKFETIAIQYAIVMQLLSYFTAIEKGCDVDQPRNLAKSVTVE
jgi:glucosamine--fructose-6-phosphate aminotransferase (isomerizing)